MKSNPLTTVSAVLSSLTVVTNLYITFIYSAIHHHPHHTPPIIIIITLHRLLRAEEEEPIIIAEAEAALRPVAGAAPRNPSITSNADTGNAPRNGNPFVPDAAAAAVPGISPLTDVHPATTHLPFGKPHVAAAVTATEVLPLRHHHHPVNNNNNSCSNKNHNNSRACRASTPRNGWIAWPTGVHRITKCVPTGS